MLFADVDSFKGFNDEHGHAVGDLVLQVVARSLTAGLRESDLAARWGGEEFVIVTAASDEAQLLPKPFTLAELGDAIAAVLAAPAAS